MINSFSNQLLKLNTVDEVLWAIAQHAIAKLDYIDCVVYLKIDKVLVQKAAFGPKNPKEFDIKNPIILNLNEGICGAVASSGKSELISDTSIDSRYRVDDDPRFSEITVPILSGDEVIGLIDSEHTEKNFFKSEDLEILETIASMVSVKISQCQAQEKILKHQEELEQRVEESTRALQNTIEELRASHAKIYQKNIEKETLLKEIHHRVKNNLQVVSSLLNLHSGKLETGNAIDVFTDCQQRVQSMSLIHEQLYGQKNFSEINAKTYIEEFVHELSRSYNTSNKIVLKCDLEELFYDLELSVPFGLILNELLTNALKHAFPKNAGTIFISLKRTNNQVILNVSDDGVGSNPDNNDKDTLGFELIETLTQQLNGTFCINTSSKGTSCSLSFFM